jgi:hypothetical protein
MGHPIPPLVLPRPLRVSFGFCFCRVNTEPCSQVQVSRAPFGRQSILHMLMPSEHHWFPPKRRLVPRKFNLDGAVYLSNSGLNCYQSMFNFLYMCVCKCESVCVCVCVCVCVYLK